MPPPKSLRARALDILSRREISRVELKRKLAPHAESEEELDRVLAEFAECNWQSDERFAEAFVHSKSSRYGSLRLKQSLAAKGIDADTAREFLPDADSELQTAIAVLRKKFKAPATDVKEKQKQLYRQSHRSRKWRCRCLSVARPDCGNGRLNEKESAAHPGRGKSRNLFGKIR